MDWGIGGSCSVRDDVDTTRLDRPEKSERITERDYLMVYNSGQVRVLGRGGGIFFLLGSFLHTES